MAWLCTLPYSGKFLRENTLANFEVLWLFVQIFFAKFGGVASFGGTIRKNFFPRKSFFHQFAEVFSYESFQLYRQQAESVCSAAKHCSTLTSYRHTYIEIQDIGFINGKVTAVLLPLAHTVTLWKWSIRTLPVYNYLTIIKLHL